MDLNSPMKMMLPQAPLPLDSEEVYTKSSTSDAGLSEEFTSYEHPPGHGPLPNGEKLLQIVYNTNARDDFSDLEIALARVLDPGTREYNKGLERIKGIQRRWAEPVEEVAREEGYRLKLRMKVRLGITGNVYYAHGSYIGYDKK